MADFELLPTDDDAVSADDEVAAAVASALATDPEPVAGQPPRPWGRTWRFDYHERRFVRQGQAPAEARGRDALRERILLALHTARYAHLGIVSGAFGMDRPEELIGETDPAIRLSDLKAATRDTLLRLDPRITGAEAEAELDPTTGDVILFFTAITDEQAPITDTVRLNPEVFRA